MKHSLSASPAAAPSTRTNGDENERAEAVAIRHLDQRALSQRWDLSEATLERWRSDGIGPAFLKLGGKVRYRQSDVLEFEQSSLRRSTSAPAA